MRRIKERSVGHNFGEREATKSSGEHHDKWRPVFVVCGRPPNWQIRTNLEGCKLQSYEQR